MLGVAIAEVGLAGLHHLFQRLADAAVGKVAPPRPGCGEDAVTVRHEGRQGEASAQHLGVLHRHPLQLPHRGVLLKDDLAVAGGEDLEGVAAADTLGAADLLRDDHPAQLIPLCQVGAKKIYKLSEKPLISMALGFPDGATMRLRGFDRLCYFRSKFDRFAPK